MSTTTPYTPKSNGLAERTHVVIITLARSCLDNEHLPHEIWNHSIINVVQARDTVVHSKTKKVLFESAFSHPPPYFKHLRPFGCLVLYRPVTSKLDRF